MNLAVVNEWPSTIPLPRADYTGGSRNASIVGAAEGEVRIRRSRFEKSYPALSVDWVLTAAQFDAFESFFLEDLGNGISSFQIELRYSLNSVLTEWAVRFSGGYQARCPDGLWEVSAELELISPIWVGCYGRYLTLPDGSPYVTSDGEYYLVSCDPVVTLATDFGIFSSIEGNDIVVGAGGPVTNGVGSITESGDVLIGAGGANATIGSLDLVEGEDTIEGESGILIEGSSSILEEGDILEGVAGEDFIIIGSASLAEGDDILSGGGGPVANGVGSITESGDTISGAGGAIAAVGTFAVTEGNDTLSGAGDTASSFSDNFARADANPMSTTSSSGGTWDVGPEALANTKILSGRAQGAAASAGALVSVPQFGSNQRATLIVNTDTITQALGIGLFLRMDAGNTGGYLLYAAGNTGAMSLTFYAVTYVGSFVTDIIGAAVDIADFVDGDELLFQASGTTLTAKINGTTIATRTDATYGSGEPGIYFNNEGPNIPSFTAEDF